MCGGLIRGGRLAIRGRGYHGAIGSASLRIMRAVYASIPCIAVSERGGGILGGLAGLVVHFSLECSRLAPAGFKRT